MASGLVFFVVVFLESLTQSDHNAYNNHQPVCHFAILEHTVTQPEHICIKI